MSLPTQPQTGAPEGQPSGAPPAGTEASQPEPQGSTTEGRSPEEVEEFWKRRQSAEAAAFAEKERVLREENTKLQRDLEAKRAAEAGAAAKDQTEVGRLQAELKAAKDALVAEQTRSTIEVRKAKYPEAATSVGDAIAHFDEADLAALNARLAGATGAPTPPPRIDPNTPGRPANGAAQPQTERSIEELKGDLAAMGPAFAAELS